MEKGACCTYQEIVLSGSCARRRRGQDTTYSSSNLVMEVFMTSKLGDPVVDDEFSYGNVPGRLAG